MPLKEFVDSLPTNKQYRIAIKLAKLALPIWEQYADDNQLTYRDTVVGLTHSVDRNLLQNSIETVEAYSNSVKRIDDNKLSSLYNEFRDPIVSLQDLDWKLPYEVETAFYSVYNLVCHATGEQQTVSGESYIYVSINQAADALLTAKFLTVDEINKILDEMAH